MILSARDLKVRGVLCALLFVVRVVDFSMSHGHRCQHGLRKMRESARNDISRAHANFAHAHKMRANYHIFIHAITLYKM